jgi:uncharacterized caspase-like protein
MRTLILILALLVTASSAKADRRVALVVGNGAYKNMPRLPDAPMSAKAMAALLKSVGFDVVEGIDLTRDRMTEKLLDFGKKAEGADVALFFYCGHAMTLNGTNYMLPIDADLKSEMDLKLGAAVELETTLDQALSDAKVKLAFLDASRDNPFAAGAQSNGVSMPSGVAQMVYSPGTLTAFAAGLGQKAPDGPLGIIRPFTRALIANIAVPGVEIQQAMTKVRAQVNEETNKKQLPMVFTNLVTEVYLNPGKAAPGMAK